MRARAASVPRMTLEEWQQHGPVGDDYVTLTDVRLGARGYALWRDGESPGNIQLYVPVYPGNLSKEPEPDSLRFVLEILDTDERKRLSQPEVVEFTCQIRRGAGQVLEDWAQKTLEKAYPGIRLADAWVLTVGLREPTMSKARSLLAHGVIAIFAGIALLLVWMRSGRPAGTFTGAP